VNCLIAPPRNILTYLLTYLLTWRAKNVDILLVTHQRLQDVIVDMTQFTTGSKQEGCAEFVKEAERVLEG